MPFPEITSIDSARLRLRPVVADDLPDLLQVNGDDRVTRFLPYATWRSLDDGRAWLGRIETLVAGGTARQLVVERSEDRRVIGAVLLFKLDEPSARLEIGYVLGQAHWHQGFAREAVQAACGHAFERLGIRRIEAEVNPDNAASCGLLQRLGFVCEGRMRQRWVGRHGVYDTHLYGCLRDEWSPDGRPAEGADR